MVGGTFQGFVPALVACEILILGAFISGIMARALLLRRHDRQIIQPEVHSSAH